MAWDYGMSDMEHEDYSLKICTVSSASSNLLNTTTHQLFIISLNVWLTLLPNVNELEPKKKRKSKDQILGPNTLWVTFKQSVLWLVGDGIFTSSKNQVPISAEWVIAILCLRLVPPQRALSTALASWSLVLEYWPWSQHLLWSFSQGVSLSAVYPMVQGLNAWFLCSSQWEIEPPPSLAQLHTVLVPFPGPIVWGEFCSLPFNQWCMSVEEWLQAWSSIMSERTQVRHVERNPKVVFLIGFE